MKRQLTQLATEESHCWFSVGLHESEQTVGHDTHPLELVQTTLTRKSQVRNSSVEEPPFRFDRLLDLESSGSYALLSGTTQMTATVGIMFMFTSVAPGSCI